MSRKETFISWAGQVVAAAVLAIAMVPKFIGAQESIDVFTTLGVEPWGRYLTAVLELVAIVLLLLPHLKRHAAGALVAVLLMIGALGGHAWKLGFSGAAGEMAGMAAVVLVASLVVLFLRRDQLRGSGKD